MGIQIKQLTPNEIKELVTGMHPNKKKLAPGVHQNQGVSLEYASSSSSWTQAFIKINYLALSMLPNQIVGPGHASKSWRWPPIFIKIKDPAPNMHQNQGVNAGQAI